MWNKNERHGKVEQAKGKVDGTATVNMSAPEEREVAMFFSLLALQWPDLSWGIVIAVALAALLCIPYLIKEIRDGKADFGPLRRLRRGKVVVGPQTPTGASDVNPGRIGDPTPGQLDGQADPYGPRAQRNAPPIQS
jgi:hypothetical protein